MRYNLPRISGFTFDFHKKYSNQVIYSLENHSLYRNSCKIIGFINLADDVNWPP